MCFRLFRVLLGGVVLFGNVLWADPFENEFSRSNRIYGPGQAKQESMEREMSHSHGIGCLCLGCQENRMAVRRQEEERQRQDVQQQFEKPSGQVKSLPRYDLETGMRVAIRNVQLQNIPVSVGNVVAELERMQRRNDVALPYSYDVTMRFSSSGKSKVRRKLNASQARLKSQMEQMIANILSGGRDEQGSTGEQVEQRKDRFPIKEFFGQKIGSIYNAGKGQKFVLFDPPEKVGRLDNYAIRLSARENRIILISAECTVPSRQEAVDEQSSLRKQLESFYRRNMEPYEDKLGNVNYSLGFNIDGSGDAHREVLLCISERDSGGWRVSMDLYDNDLYRIEMERQ